MSRLLFSAGTETLPSILQFFFPLLNIIWLSLKHILPASWHGKRKKEDVGGFSVIFKIRCCPVVEEEGIASICIQSVAQVHWGASRL